ncbi:hypothetical protein HKX48_000054 [Thoreauomyces humboldtii]|nr:hypothetical protein HKX48_000054 [Thoreauomyces humboldtii]
MNMDDMTGMSMGMTSPDCFAHDSAFLTTLAYCISSHCDSLQVPTWKREKFWETQVTGDVNVLPKWSYSVALEQVNNASLAVYDPDSMTSLNQTALLADSAYHHQSRFMLNFDYMEALQAKYIFVLLGVAVGLPIVCTLLPRLPYVTTVIHRVKPFLVYPSIFGTYNVRPLPWLMGNVPTVGQALYIFLFVVLNVILASVNYSSTQPHPWGWNFKGEMCSYVAYRTGHIAFGLLPLLILFSGRNNFLLWITNWSYPTFLLLHRWIARAFTFHAIAHSVALLITWKESGAYATDSSMPYWIWGVVGTVAACAMLVLSHLYFRRLAYEAFLILHIVLAALVIVGCWYHIVLRWQRNFYTNWVLAAIAVWAFDRIIRPMRVIKNGIRHAVVTECGPDHVRVDIPRIRWPNKPGQVAYAYFPTLDLRRPWENHPFSIASTALFRAPTGGDLSVSHVHSEIKVDGHEDIGQLDTSGADDASGKNPQHPVGVPPTGITMIIKRSQGLTKHLASNRRLLTLLEGPYKQNSSSHVLMCDRVVLVGGGIGIMGLAGWIGAHHHNVKLAWSVRQRHRALVDELAPALKGLADKEVRVGERLDVESLLRGEAEAGYAMIGVVVCGPGGMCDDVREVVGRLGRNGRTVFELEVDAYSW